MFKSSKEQQQHTQNIFFLVSLFLRKRNTSIQVVIVYKQEVFLDLFVPVWAENWLECRSVVGHKTQLCILQTPEILSPPARYQIQVLTKPTQLFGQRRLQQRSTPKICSAPHFEKLARLARERRPKTRQAIGEINLLSDGGTSQHNLQIKVILSQPTPSPPHLR
jgi:hypothetical protein